MDRDLAVLVVNLSYAKSLTPAVLAQGCSVRVICGCPESQRQGLLLMYVSGYLIFKARHVRIELPPSLPMILS